jgi:hypothetical protein
MVIENMKTSVIDIEIHDDVGSLKDKILWSQSNRILLVASPHTKLLQRRIDLILLKRHANRLGAQLAFVTFQTETIEIAKDLKIPVFSSIRKAQYENWHADQRTKNDGILKETHKRIRRTPDSRNNHTENKNPRLSFLIFFIGATVPIILALCLAPTARITIPDDVEFQREDMLLSVSSQPGGTSFILQPRILSETIEESITSTATGKIAISDQAATGTVHFTNLTENAILIPKGTIVRTDEQVITEFFSTEDAFVAGGAGKTADCLVQAVIPGEGGNIASQIIRLVQGPLSTEIKVTNLQPMVGGTVMEINAVSQQDLTNARSQLDIKLAQSALQAFQEKTTENNQLLTSTLSMQSRIESITPGLDQPADFFVYSVKSTFTIWFYSKDELIDLVNTMMDQTLEAGYSADPDSIQFSQINQIINKTDKSIELHFEVERETQKDLINAILNLDLAGLTKSEAVSQIEKKVGIENTPRVETVPSWWLWMPLLPARISIGYQE